ncbi:hypothetical protein SEUCBS140593_007085 [Sporothrix eucalyptigena]|uniref:Uncharacterized protein n=1 Tax=Sporothrix eucalyptigena TaxID=1812306 RepID=A0ABP0CA84_9PEZI
MDMVEAANADAWHKTQTCSGYVDTAALVLWGQTMEKKDTGSSTSANANSPNGVVLAKKKVFGTFERELEQMNPAWGCIRRMIDIIKALK